MKSIIIDGIGNDISKTKCFFCGQKSHWISNFPEYGKYTCEPCYLLAKSSPSKWSLIRRYFSNDIYFDYQCNWVFRFIWWKFCRILYRREK
jgi:hypothetical protein